MTTGKLGLGALVLVLFIPDVALFVLVGVAFNWWVSAVIFGGGFGAALLALVLGRREAARRSAEAADFPHS